MGAIMQPLIFGSCLFSLSIFFLSASLIVRSLPTLIRLFFQALRGILMISYRLYLLILKHIEPEFKRQFGILVMDRVPRVFLSIVLSNLIGLIFCLIFHWHVTLWIIAILSMHGLFIGYAWSAFFEQPGIRMGERLH